MKMRTCLWMVVLVTVLFSSSVSALENPSQSDRTGSPYFLVEDSEEGQNQFPLKSTAVDVQIAGVIAEVRVTQVYANQGSKPLEAIYVFPASTRAAVHGLRMRIGNRTITAEIRESRAARQIYEQAKEQGRSGALLEQERPNVFQMRVANILPGETIEVCLHYTELLVPVRRTYSFVYPTVVGPRYTGPQGRLQPRSESWTANPYLQPGQSSPSRLDIKVQIQAGLPLAALSCESHATDIRFRGRRRAEVRLKTSEQQGGNRDFILDYRLAGGQIESGLLVSEEGQEKYFLMMLQPPETVHKEAMPPREYVFVVDVSGSMRGFPLNVSKQLLKGLLRDLRPEDRFNILLFAGGSRLMAERSLPATAGNIQEAGRFIDQEHGGGGTQLLPALKRALALPMPEGVSRSVLVVTDGYVQVEKEAFDLIRNQLGRANLFTFGIGSSVNRFLVEGMAHAGMGRPFVVTQPEQAEERAREFRELVSRPVLTDIRIDYGNWEVFDIEPRSLPDVFADRPLIIFGKWRGEFKGQVRLQGASGRTKYSRVFDLDSGQADQGGTPLKYLWARQRIRQLSDYQQLDPDDKRAQVITRLGLKYQLLTESTSFVAVDSKQRTLEQSCSVRQPLPLPQGVPASAVAGSPTPAIMQTPRLTVQGEAKKVSPRLKEAITSQDNGLSRDVSEQVEGDESGCWRKIVVSEASLEQAVSTVLHEKCVQLAACLAHLEESVQGLKLTIEVDAFGRVFSVQSKGEGVTHKARQCLKRLLSSCRFPASAAGSDYTIQAWLM